MTMPKFTYEVRPDTPGAIKVVLGGQEINMSIHEFTDAELRVIGLEWTRALLEKAGKKRKDLAAAKDAIGDGS